jgi:hypothetical protein
LVFGSGKWQKTLTDEELRIVDRYLSSCRCEFTSCQDGGVVHFRHAASAKWTGERKVKTVEMPDGHNPVVCGHNKNIGVGEMQVAYRQ